MNVNTETSAKSGEGFSTFVIRDAQDTLDLRYGVLATNGEPTRYVVFMNGRTEWIEKYDYVPKDLQLPAGTGFLTWDHRGQGASGGARAYVDDYDSYAQDAAAIVQRVVGEAPYVILAHSMGGLIALNGVLKGYLKPSALALSSPLLGMPNDPVPRPLARPIANLLTACQLGALSSGAGTYTRIPFEKNKLTHHLDLYQRMQDSPYKVPGATFGWVSATFKALEYCFSETALARLNVPTLVLGCTEEKVVDYASFQAWVQKAAKIAPAEVQLHLVAGAKHELFSEIPSYYREAIAVVRSWFKPHLQ